jgi:hypothetical protein
VLCKHEVVGSIPSGSTIRRTDDGDRRTDEPLGAGGEQSFKVLSFARRVKASCARSKENDRGDGYPSSVIRSPPSIYDIVKRKHIQPRLGGGKNDKTGSGRQSLSVLCRPYSVVRLRASQSWGFA